MSNVYYEKYAQAYHELVLCLAELHNNHIDFKNTVGRRAGLRLKSTNKRVIALCKAVSRTVVAAHTEKTREKIVKKKQTREALLVTRRIRERNVTNRSAYGIK